MYGPILKDTVWNPIRYHAHSGLRAAEIIAWILVTTVLSGLPSHIRTHLYREGSNKDCY